MKLFSTMVDETDECFACRAPRCRRRVVASGDNGSLLPFCVRHLAELPSAQLRRIEELAKQSPFNPAGVEAAEAEVKRALRRIARRAS